MRYNYETPEVSGRVIAAPPGNFSSRIAYLQVSGGGALACVRRLRRGATVLTFIAGVLLYFLPAIVGRHKHDAVGIFVVNLLFGWTVIGWVIAMIWACAAEPRIHYIPVA